MAGHGWTWLDMVSGHGWTWLDMAGHGYAPLPFALQGCGHGAQVSALQCRDVQEKRPRPPGEEALYKYPTRRVGTTPHAGSGGVETPTDKVRLILL